MTESTSRSEEFQFSGDTLLAKIKEIIREGNIRRVVIKNEDGRVLDRHSADDRRGRHAARAAARRHRRDRRAGAEGLDRHRERDAARGVSRPCEGLSSCMSRAWRRRHSRSLSVDEYLLAVTHDLPPAAKEALQRIDGTAAATARGARLSPRRETTALALELVGRRNPRLRGQPGISRPAGRDRRGARALRSSESRLLAVRKHDGPQPGPATAALELERVRRRHC